WAAPRPSRRESREPRIACSGYLRSPMACMSASRRTADIARRVHRHPSRSVMSYHGHGQVRRTFCGLIAVDDRRHDDDHHRVVLDIAALARMDTRPERLAGSAVVGGFGLLAGQLLRFGMCCPPDDIGYWLAA